MNYYIYLITKTFFFLILEDTKKMFSGNLSSQKKRTLKVNTVDIRKVLKLHWIQFWFSPKESHNYSFSYFHPRTHTCSIRPLLILIIHLFLIRSPTDYVNEEKLIYLFVKKRLWIRIFSNLFYSLVVDMC
jgi:hypothetical protein